MESYPYPYPYSYPARAGSTGVARPVLPRLVSAAYLELQNGDLRGNLRVPSRWGVIFGRSGPALRDLPGQELGDGGTR